MKKKYLTEEDKIVNHLSSSLHEALEDSEDDPIFILYFFANSLLAAKVDSKIIVKVLEEFPDTKEIILGIKVNEGW